MKNTQKSIRLGSLFDGIGGFPYAGLFYGIEPTWGSEILPQAISVTMRHMPWMKHVGDITKLDGTKLPPVDVITFGSPCQDLSTAGKRLGMKGERSGLFTEAIRIIDEMRRATNGRYPRYALWENVPGAMSSGHPAGSDFRAVLEAFTKTKIPMPASGRWANSGMARSGGVDLAWRVLNAQYHGVPQRRRRIFLVADFGGESAGEILFIEEGLRGYFASCCEAWQGITADAQRGTGVTDSGGVTAFAANQRDKVNCHALAREGPLGDEVRNLHNISAAICASQTMKQQTFIAKDTACLTPWDTQQLRVFTDDGTSPTLAGADGGGGRNPAGLVITENSEAAPRIEILNDQGGESITVEQGGQSPTLRHEAHGNLPIVSLCETYPINTQLASRHNALGNGTGFGIAKNGDPAYTLQETHSHAVAYSVHQSGEGDLSTSETTKSLTTLGTASCRNAPLVAHPDVSGTLCASGAGLSRPAGMASEPDLCVAYALQGNMVGRKERNGPNGSGVSKNLSFTLTATDTPAVASAIPIHDRATRFQGGGPSRSGDGCGNGLGVGKAGDPAPTLTSGDHHAVSTPKIASGKDSVGTLMANAGTKMWLGNQEAFSGDYFPIQNYIVRRLTPTECERLQGFPDGWTLYGADGKEISDTRRYQMLGNSVAVPCVAYILSGIAAQLYHTEEVAA